MTGTDEDIKYMKRALQLAARGLGTVAPNPMVGCVIVNKGRIIGEGWHRQYGKAHAEVNAVNSVKDPSDLKGATVYISLEPCSFHGNTPPCADLLSGLPISRVVIAGIDPHPRVMGKGREIIRKAGIDFDEGILIKEAEYLNRRFLTFHDQERPYIILKWAQTKDGYIARKNYNSKWVSNGYSRKLVHKWRGEEPAIMVGRNTVEYDDPELTTRMWSGKDPLRLVIDPRDKLGADRKIFQNEGTWVFTEEKEGIKGAAKMIPLGKADYLQRIMHYLYEKKIQSVFVEGGSYLINSLIDAGLWDEARVFISEKEFGEGITAPDTGSDPANTRNIHGDKLLTFYNTPYV